MKEKPSLLLTGGSGLLAVNWFYSKNSDYNIFLGLNQRVINPSSSHIIFLDFYSEERLLNQLEAINPSLVIHTAGLTSVEKCESNPELAFHTNVELSCIVAKVTKRLGIKLVHVSTDHLFDGNVAYVSENVPPNPINVYGRTKALAEVKVSEFNPDALIIRSNFYSWGTSYRKSFSDQIIQSLRQNRNLNLFEDVLYTPILIEKLIVIVHDLLDNNAQGIYNVVSDNIVSKYEFGMLIAEEFRFDKSLIKKSKIQSQINLVKRPLDMSLSNEKVTNVIGRNLGTVKQHIARLHELEFDIITKEIQSL